MAIGSSSDSPVVPASQQLLEVLPGNLLASRVPPHPSRVKSSAMQQLHPGLQDQIAQLQDHSWSCRLLLAECWVWETLATHASSTQPCRSVTCSLLHSLHIL